MTITYESSAILDCQGYTNSSLYIHGPSVRGGREGDRRGGERMGKEGRGWERRGGEGGVKK